MSRTIHFTGEERHVIEMYRRALIDMGGNTYEFCN